MGCATVRAPPRNRSSNGRTKDRSRHLRRRAVPSSLPPALEGRVQNLDYKTLRFRLQVIFRAMLEVGLFDEVTAARSGIAPRTRCCWRHF